MEIQEEQCKPGCRHNPPVPRHARPAPFAGFKGFDEGGAVAQQCVAPRSSELLVPQSQDGGESAFCVRHRIEPASSLADRPGCSEDRDNTPAGNYCESDQIEITPITPSQKPNKGHRQKACADQGSRSDNGCK